MKTHVVVNNMDLTPYIVSGSYDVYSEDTYESWNDGNMVEHRIVVTDKVMGSFEIGCSDKRDGITLSDFLTNWNAATDNKVVTIGLYIPNKDKFEAFNCYYSIRPKEHILTGNGDFIDVLTIEIKER